MMGRDDPAVAEAIVLHAEAVCEHEDDLWHVIAQTNIPTNLLTDNRTGSKTGSKTDYKTDEMVRSFLYAKIKGLSQNELADRLKHRVTLLHCFQFDINDQEEAPVQQSFSYAWKNFSDGTQRIINAAAAGIAQAAVEHDVITDRMAVILEEDEDTDEADADEDDSESEQKQATRTIKLARKYAFPEFESGRCINRTYDDVEILDMIARTCAYTGSAHSEGEYGWLTDDDLTADGSTILRVIKEFTTPDDDDADLTIDEILNDDRMPDIEAIRGELMKSFDAAINNIITTLEGSGPFSDRRKTAAIDITHEQFYARPWVDKSNKIPKPEFPRMVSGYKKDNEYKRGYKYASITLAGDLAPIILGVEPVKENSKWEEDDAPSYSKAEMVDRLLAKAERFVDLDEVFLDRGFHSTGVYAAIEDRGITYTAPVPKYEDDYTVIKEIEEHPSADAAVNHDVPVVFDGDIHHHTEFLYVPSENEDKEGKYAVFITNRDRVETDEIEEICNRYSRRWDIESQYKSIKDCLPRTSSKDYRVRFCNFVLTALLYDLWRLTDYLIKVGKDVEIRSPPEVGFKTFVRAVGDFLRDIG